jgi:uncharacterized membrane protein YgaE (UPF0421/DUF939 family)
LRDRLERDNVQSVVRPVVVHSARTALAAVASVLVARLFRLPEAYWAPITTLVITQSSLGAALTVSWQRLVGTVLGAVVAAMVASLFGSSLFVFGASLFILGLLCAFARSDRSAYRFAGVTLAVVLLIPRANPVWQVAIHRFAEVSIGIAVALILAVAWPESESTPPGHM